MVYVIRCTTGWEELPTVVVTVTFLPTATSDGSCDVGSIMYVTVDPSARVELDRGLLASFPVGYRHLAYLQARNGFAVKPDMPGLTGPEVDALYSSGEKWLSGENLDR